MVIKFLSNIEEWKDFSNLAPYSIFIEGETWKSVEHYYQFKKFEKTDYEYAVKIKNAPTPKDAKILSMKNDNIPSNWDDIKVDILKSAVKVKFETYDNLKKLLLSTGDEELVENNVEDSFWGIGSDGKGKNMMGKILMSLREELKKAVKK